MRRNGTLVRGIFFCYFNVMAITKKEIEHVASLARIKLTETEKEKYAQEIGQILTYIEKLKQIDTENVEPTAQVTGLENVLRLDNNPIPPNTNTASLIGQFSDKKDNFLKVRQVFENND